MRVFLSATHCTRVLLHGGAVVDDDDATAVRWLRSRARVTMTDASDNIIPPAHVTVAIKLTHDGTRGHEIDMPFNMHATYSIA